MVAPPGAKPGDFHCAAAAAARVAASVFAAAAAVDCASLGTLTSSNVLLMDVADTGTERNCIMDCVGALALTAASVGVPVLFECKPTAVPGSATGNAPFVVENKMDIAAARGRKLKVTLSRYLNYAFVVMAPVLMYVVDCNQRSTMANPEISFKRLKDKIRSYNECVTNQLKIPNYGEALKCIIAQEKQILIVLQSLCQQHNIIDCYVNSFSKINWEALDLVGVDMSRIYQQGKESFLDFFGCSYVDPSNEYFQGSAAAHPNQRGHKLIAEKLSTWINYISTTKWHSLI